MSRRHNPRTLEDTGASDLWRELLEQDGVRATIEKAISAANRPPREDFESYAWDEAVTLAMKFANEHADDPDGFQSFLYVSLTRWAWRNNLSHLRGSRPPKVDDQGNYLTTASPRYEAWHGTSIDSAVDGRTNVIDLEQATKSGHRLRRDDPLAILLKTEFLEGLARRAQTEAHATGYTTATDDVFCLEPICRKLAVTRGYCRAHYTRHMNLWGATGARCSADDCTSTISTAGMCRYHYELEWKRARRDGDDITRTCQEDGCTQPAEDRKRCTHHIDQARRLHTRPCTEPRCPYAARDGGGLCASHARAKQAENAAPCNLDDCDRPGIGGRGMCRKHYEADRIRRRETGEAA